MKKLMVVTTLIVVSLVLVYVLFFSNVFSIKKYTIEGVSFSEKEINEVLHKYKSKNIFLTSSSEIKQELSKINFVKGVVIEKKFPSTLLLTVEERVPVGQIVTNSKSILISDEFMVLDIRAIDDDIPIFQGFEHSQPKIGEEISIQPISVFERAKNLSKLLRLTEISGGIIRQKDKSIIYYINDDYYVDFGKDGDIDQKFTVFMTYYEQVAKKQNIQKGIIRIYDNKRLTFQPFEEGSKEENYEQ